MMENNKYFAEWDDDGTYIFYSGKKEPMPRFGEIIGPYETMHDCKMALIGVLKDIKQNLGHIIYNLNSKSAMELEKNASISDRNQI